MSENEAKTDYVCGDECCGECSGEIDGRCHCPVTEKQHTIGMTNEEMLATAKRSITRLDFEIKELAHLRDVWMKISGKIEGEMHGRILP